MPELPMNLHEPAQERLIIRFLKIPDSWKLLLSMIAYGIGQGILRPMNAIYLKDHVHLDKLQISTLIALTLVADLIITFVLGYLSDKVKNKRRLPMIAASISIVGLLLYLRADSFASALIALLLVTGPGGIIMGQLFAMARNHYTKEAKDMTETAMVWLRAVFSFGFFLGLLLGAEIFTMVSFRGVLVGNLVANGVLLLIVLIYRERTEYAEPLKRNAVPFDWVILLAFLLILCGDAIRGLYFPLMVDSLYHSPALVSRLWSLQAIFELLWMTLAGVLATKYGALRVIRYGSMLGILVYLVYALHPSLPLLILMQPIHSFYVSTLYSVAMGYVQRMFLHRTGFGSSLYLVLTQLASLVGYFLPNLIPGFTPSIFLLPAAFVVVAVPLLWLRRERIAQPATA